MTNAARGELAMTLNHRDRAFTLVELLVVIAIIGVLVALTVAAVQQVRFAAARIVCADHFRQIGLALHNYEGVHRTLPPGVSVEGGNAQYPYMGWQTRLLPYIEQDNLWHLSLQAYQRDRWPLDNPPHVGLNTVIKLYTCPMDARAYNPQLSHDRYRVALTSYLGNEGTDYAAHDGLLYTDSAVPLVQVTDGTSHTLLAGERPASADLFFGWWYAGAGQAFTGSGDMILGALERNSPRSGIPCPPGPYEFGPGNEKTQCDLFHFWSFHSGGANFLLADGSVHFLSYSARSVLPALATRSGDEAVEVP
jgi:prepilin-type N-terminal cleavage/methylation domain-containing protein/prepilin-type processing-associated H-X9-DG protein